MEILLNNIDITNFVKIQGLSLKEKLNYKVDTFSFDFMLEGKYVEPKDGDEVVVKIDSVIVFSGVIDNIDLSISENKTGYMKVTVSDYTRLVSKKLINNSYKNKTVSEIVIDIIDNELDGYGITKGTIDDITINLEDVLFDYKKASDVLTDLADYVLGYWLVTPDKKLHFRVKGSSLAPFNISDGNDTYIPNTLKIKKNSQQLRNVILIVGSDYVGVDTTDKIGDADGEMKTFLAPYIYDELPTVTVNGILQNVGVAYLDTSGFDCYWDRNGKNINFDTAPSTGGVVVVGKPLIPLVFQMDASGDTKYEFKIIDKTLKSIEAVKQRAKAEIEEYSQALTSGSFSTYLSGFHAGQKISLQSDILNISTEFIITSVDTQFRGVGKLKYKVNLASKSEYEMVDLFRHLLRKGEKEFGFFRNTDQTIVDYMGIKETIQFNETVIIKNADIIQTENVVVSETVKLRDDYQTEFV